MLEITVFLSGALVMILEMVGTRVLAPHVGTSVIVWTSLIGIILAFLALGSFLGGKLADKNLSTKGLSKILFGASIGTAITAFLHNMIGSSISTGIDNIYIATLLCALFIFSIPALFFGMVTPYCIRLRMENINTAGQTVGKLYALSTTGSILGTFLGGFILISFLRSSVILWFVAISMLILSIIQFKQKIIIRLILMILCIICLISDSLFSSVNSMPMLQESAYNSIKLQEGTDYLKQGRAIRLMATDPGYSQSGMLIDSPNTLYFDYTKFYALGPYYNPNAKKILMLGGGGYSVPKWLLAGKSGLARDFNLTVVELDPKMTEISKKWFNLPNDPRLNIIHEDARIFLNKHTEKYDLIFVDVFNSHYSIPFHMSTKEAGYQLARALNEDGIILMNIISAVDGPDGRLFRGIYSALKENFKYLRLYCIGRPDKPNMRQNIMLLAKKTPFIEDQINLIPNKETAEPNINEIKDMLSLQHLSQVADDIPALSDDFAPVERYTLMLLKKP